MATPLPPNNARLTAWSVAAATSGRIRRVTGEGRVASFVTTDSRAVVHGSAFVALRGEHHDGHDFVAMAVLKGASLVVVEHSFAFPEGCPAEDVDIVEVADTLVAWADLARAHLRDVRRERQPGRSLRTVAITGSAGKTTTKEFTAALLSSCGETLKAAGNLNNRIGVPATAFCVDARHAFAVFEAGMSLRGEIAALASIIEPDVAVITNIGTAHAAGVGGGRAGVAAEKGDLFRVLTPSGMAIANADDAAVMGQLAGCRAGSSRTFGRASSADYRVVARTRTADGRSTVTVSRPIGGSIDVALNLSGEVAALDFAAALAAAEAAALAPIDAARIRAAAASVKPLAGRGATTRFRGDIVVIDDSYNANPESVRASIASAVELADVTKPRGRVVCVFGEMKELGETAVGQHIALGEAAAARGVGLVISCGGLSSVLADAAAERGVAVVKAATVAEAGAAAVREIRPRDVVLVKASRSVGVEAVVAAITRAFESTGRESGKSAASTTPTERAH